MKLKILALSVFVALGAFAVDPKDIDATVVRKQLQSETSIYNAAYMAAETYAINGGMELAQEAIGSIHAPDLFFLTLKFKPKVISKSGKYPVVLIDVNFALPTNFEQVVLKKDGYKFYYFTMKVESEQMFPQPGDTSSAGGKQMSPPQPTSAE